MNNLKIAIGSDHAGYALKKKVVEWLSPTAPGLTDLGTYDEQSADYPDIAHLVANEVEGGKYNFGILICGTGLGVDMSANKHKGIRSALCWNKEIAGLARSHNDANIICLPGRFISIEEAKEILDTFFSTFFEGGRHENRRNKISC